MSPPEWTNWQNTSAAPDPQEYVVREPPPYNRPDVPVNTPQPGFNSSQWVPGEEWAEPQPAWLCGPLRAETPRRGQPINDIDPFQEEK